jgi:hypothetical protein
MTDTVRSAIFLRCGHFLYGKGRLLRANGRLTVLAVATYRPISKLFDIGLAACPDDN